MDNSGSVMMFKKGYSTKCNLCCTLLVAINEVARAIGCEVDIRKIRRCSNDGAKAADHLSKSALSAFKATIPEANPVPDVVPQALLSWLTDPVPDRFLGRKIVQEMGKSFSLIEH